MIDKKSSSHLLKSFIVFISFLFVGYHGFSQENKIRKAEDYFKLQRYYDASSIYRELIEDDKIKPERYATIYRHAFEAQFKAKKYDQAKNTLEYFSGSEEFTFDDAHDYMQLMLYMGKIEEMRSMFNHKVVQEAIDPRKEAISKYVNTPFIDEMKQDSLKYSLTLAPFNSDAGDFSPTYHPKGIAFTSARDQGMSAPWAAENSTFLSQYLYDNFTGKVGKIKGVKGKKHDGVACYDSIDGTWYYTKNVKKDPKSPIVQVGIFQYNETTKKEEAFAYNRPDQFSGHPCLSSDKQLLWFVSNRDGGLGGLDLWYCVKDQTGWSEPINAGPQVNTSFDEMFPYEKQGKLYFASKGHLGLGGLDVYEAELQGLDIVSVKNAGYPLNSHGDDFSFIVDQDEKSGYIASNRGDFIDRIYAVSIKEVIIELQAKVVGTTGDGLADVAVKIYDKDNKLVDSLLTDASGQFVFKGKPNQAYKIKLDKPGYAGTTEDFNTEGKIQAEVVQKEFTLSEDISKTIAFSSTITDKETGNVVAGAKVEIKDLTTGKITELIADKDGKINVDLIRDREYQFTTSKVGYDPTGTLINTKIRDKEMQQDIQIRKTPGAPMVRLDNILYDFNKATLSKIGKAELDTLVMFLKENKSVKVDISSHTDARGSDEYNMKLSAARSSSCMTYIVSKGITRDRLEVKNYGETKLLNHCDDGIECSEELHQVNRRTEFVLKFP